MRPGCREVGEVVDLESARAAYALAGKAFRFRCSVCGGSHRAGQKGWRKCARELAGKWGLVRPEEWSDGEGPVGLDSAVEVGFFPTLAEALRLGEKCPTAGWRHVYHERLRPPAVLTGEGAWFVLLMLDPAALQRILWRAWDGWWDQVVRFLREVDAEVKACCRDAGLDSDIPRVLRKSEKVAHWWPKVFYTEPYGLSLSPEVLHVGKRAAAYRLTRVAETWEAATVVHWHSLGARVAVYHQLEPCRSGLIPPPWWFLDAAGLA